jgi:hypothetical protein
LLALLLLNFQRRFLHSQFLPAEQSVQSNAAGEERERQREREKLIDKQAAGEGTG